MIIHETITGAIIRGVVCTPDQVRFQVRDGESAIDGTADGSSHYVPAGSLTARPTMPASIDQATISADGVDSSTISGLPVGAEISVNSIIIGVVDESGSFTFTTDAPGAYAVRVSLFPWRDHEGTINAI